MAKDTKKKSIKQIFGGIALVAVLLIGFYAAYWFTIAHYAKDAYVVELSKLANKAEIDEPLVSGFPGKLVLSKDVETIVSDRGALRIENLRAESWPFPSMPVDIETGKISLESTQWVKGLSFDRFSATMRVSDTLVTFDDSLLMQDDFSAKLTGTVDISRSDIVIPDLIVTLSNHEDFLSVLVNSGIIEKQAAAFVGFGMAALMDEDKKVQVPIYEKNGMINLGPLPVMRLPTEAQASIERAPRRTKLTP